MQGQSATKTERTLATLLMATLVFLVGPWVLSNITESFYFPGLCDPVYDYNCEYVGRDGLTHNTGPGPTCDEVWQHPLMRWQCERATEAGEAPFEFWSTGGYWTLLAVGATLLALYNVAGLGERYQWTRWEKAEAIWERFITANPRLRLGSFTGLIGGLGFLGCSLFMLSHVSWLAGILIFVGLPIVTVSWPVMLPVVRWLPKKS